MAYADSDKEKEKSLEEGGAVETGPQAGSADLAAGGAAAAGGNTAANQAETTSQASGKPGNFVGIKQYLDANKNQSQKLANNLGGYVEGVGKQASDTLGQQQGLYNQEVDQNTVKLDDNLVNDAKQNIVGVASDAGKATAFKNMREGAYKGPENFQTSQYAQPANQALQKAQTAGQNTVTEQGQKSLINQYQQGATGKTAGTGATNFDQMLLQSGGGRDTLAKAKQSIDPLANQFAAAQEASNAKAQQAKATSAQTAGSINELFGYGGQYGQQGIEKQAQLRANDYIAQANNKINRLKNLDLSSLSAQDKAELGISDQDVLGLSEMAQRGDSVGADVNNAKYLKFTSPEAQINAQNSATADEYAKYAALNQLMNGTGQFLSDPSQAGKYNLDVADFDAKGANQAWGDSISAALKQRAEADARNNEAIRAAEEKKRTDAMLYQAQQDSIRRTGGTTDADLEALRAQSSLKNAPSFGQPGYVAGYAAPKSTMTAAQQKEAENIRQAYGAGGAGRG